MKQKDWISFMRLRPVEVSNVTQVCVESLMKTFKSVFFILGNFKGSQITVKSKIEISFNASNNQCLNITYDLMSIWFNWKCIWSCQIRNWLVWGLGLNFNSRQKYTTGKLVQESD